MLAWEKTISKTQTGRNFYVCSGSATVTLVMWEVSPFLECFFQNHCQIERESKYISVYLDFSGIVLVVVFITVSHSKLFFQNNELNNENENNNETKWNDRFETTKAELVNFSLKLSNELQLFWSKKKELKKLVFTTFSYKIIFYNKDSTVQLMFNFIGSFTY